MNSTKKLHHFLPVAYLKQFANATGKVRAYRKDNPSAVIWQRPSQVGFHKHYYRQPKPDGGFDHNLIEDFFSQLESKWSRIVDRLRNREDVNDSLEDIFAFMALQHARVPAARDAFEFRLAETVRCTARIMDEADKFQPKPEKLLGIDDLWDLVEVSIDPHMSIHGMVPLIHELDPVYARVGIMALHNRTATPFLTSDNPTVWFDPSIHPSNLRPYEIHEDGPIVLLFPVSPQLMIFGITDLFDEYARFGLGYGDLTDEEMVAMMNSQISRFAYENAYASKDGFEEVVGRFSDRSPLLESISNLGGKAISFQYAWGPRRRKPKWKFGRDQSNK